MEKFEKDDRKELLEESSDGFWADSKNDLNLILKIIGILFVISCPVFFLWYRLPEEIRSLLIAWLDGCRIPEKLQFIHQNTFRIVFAIVLFGIYHVMIFITSLLMAVSNF